MKNAKSSSDKGASGILACGKKGCRLSREAVIPGCNPEGMPYMTGYSGGNIVKGNKPQTRTRKKLIIVPKETHYLLRASLECLHQNQWRLTDKDTCEECERSHRPSYVDT